MRSVTDTVSFCPSARPITSAASPCGLIVCGSTTSIVSSPTRRSFSHESPSLNCSGSTPMPIRLERWMRSKLRATTASMPSSAVPLAAQSRLDPVPYSSPAKITVGTPAAM